MGNIQNIEKNFGRFKDLSTEELSKIQSKGGKNSVESRRRRKSMREQAELLLSLPVKNDKMRARMKEIGIDETDMDNQMAMLVTTLNKSYKGDMTAVNVLRELVGERVQEMNINVDVDSKVKELHTLLNEIKQENE